MLFTIINLSCQNINNECNNFFKNNNPTEFYYKAHNKGKDAIPYLIGLIDCNSESDVGFVNPYSSTIDKFLFKNFKGIMAAYAIELILAKDKLEYPVVFKYEFPSQKHPYNIYNYGVIFNKQREFKPLSYDETKEIKNIYNNWWDKNKSKSLNQLRLDWKQKGNILKDSPYEWK